MLRPHVGGAATSRGRRSYLTWEAQLPQVRGAATNIAFLQHIGYVVRYVHVTSYFEIDIDFKPIRAQVRVLVIVRILLLGY